MAQDENNGHPPNIETAEVISTTDVRQGVTGHKVRYVLVISMITAIVALAAITVMIAV